MAKKQMTDSEIIRELQAVFENTFGERMDRHGEDIAATKEGIKGVYREFKRLNGSVKANTKDIGDLRVQTAVTTAKLAGVVTIVTTIITIALNKLLG